MRERVAAVIVAAGAGTRLGSSTPKAFIPLGGRPLYAHALSVFASHPLIDNTVLVVPGDMVDATREAAGQPGEGPGAVTVVAGGGQRWESVRNGVDAAPEDAGWVLVHDAARPFVTPAVINAVLDMRNKYRAAVTVTPVTDTVRTFSADNAGRTIDRSSLVRVGTPQLFHRETLREGFARAAAMRQPPTDEAVLFEAMGLPVGIAWGDPLNFKITTAEDLLLAEALYEKRETLRLGR